MKNLAEENKEPVAAPIPACPWKECSAELPDADRTVLIHSPEWDGDPVDIGYLDEDAWRLMDGMRLEPAPTHWMDLPEPPQQTV